MGADAPEFVIQAVQVFAEQTHHLHAVVTVVPKEVHKTLTRDESHRRMVSGFRSDPVLLPGHALAQAQDRPGTGDLQQLQAALRRGQQNANLARLDYEYPADCCALLEQGCPLGINSDRLDPMERFPQIRA